MDPNANRMLECPARTAKGTCQLVDMALGFRNAMKLITCDECFTKGPRSSQAAAYRGKYVDLCVNGLKPIDKLRRSPRELIFAMTALHLTPGEATAAMADPDVWHQMNAEILWQDARASFEEAGHFQKGTLKDFLKSMWSRLFDRPIDPEMLALRRKSCFNQPCPSLSIARDGVRHYCGACGCGEKEIAMLDDPMGEGRYTKLEYPKLMCPRRRPGFSNATLSVNGHPV